MTRNNEIAVDIIMAARAGQVRADIAVINQHIPSLSDENDEEMDELRATLDDEGVPCDNADLAIRTCMCGKRIDGFYEYVDHLKEVLT